MYDQYQFKPNVQCFYDCVSIPIKHITNSKFSRFFIILTIASDDYLVILKQEIFNRHVDYLGNHLIRIKNNQSFDYFQLAE